MTRAQRRVLEALKAGGFITYADRHGFWLIWEREAAPISERFVRRLFARWWIYDFGDYGLSPAGRAALKAPGRRRAGCSASHG